MVLPASTIKNIVLTLNAQHGLIQVSPFSAQIYDGNVQGGLTLDARPAVPQWHIVSDFKHININALLNSLKKLSYLQVSGLGDVAANLNTVGNNADLLKQNLNGNVKFQVTNGVLHGIDIPYYSELADALANKTQPSVSNSQQNAF